MDKQRISQIIVFPLLLLAAIAAVGLFFISSVEFIQNYVQEFPVIVYDRRLWAMLGIGLALLGIVIWGLNESPFKRLISPRFGRYSAKLISSGLIVMLALPLVTSLAVGPLMTSRGYTLCEQAAYPYHLPGFGEQVYLNDSELCLPWQQFRALAKRF